MSSKGKVASVRNVRRDGSIEWRNKEGQLHREDGPAREWPARNARAWYQNGKLHREDGPASEGPLGRSWHVNGKKHRLDGPAVELADGTRQWYRNGKLHREDGPAEEDPKGGTSWYRHGRLHREDGPAVELADGTTEWYVAGVQLTPGQVEEIRKGQIEALGDAFKKGLDHPVTLKKTVKFKIRSTTSKSDNHDRERPSSARRDCSCIAMLINGGPTTDPGTSKYAASRKRSDHACSH